MQRAERLFVCVCTYSRTWPRALASVLGRRASWMAAGRPEATSARMSVFVGVVKRAVRTVPANTPMKMGQGNQHASRVGQAPCRLLREGAAYRGIGARQLMAAACASLFKGLFAHCRLGVFCWALGRAIIKR